MTTPPDASTRQPQSAGPGRARDVVKVAVALAAVAGSGWFIYGRLFAPDPYYFAGSRLAFVEHAQSNVPLDGQQVGQLQFVDTAGQPVDLAQFLGRKHVVLVVTRGNTTRTAPSAYEGNICLYCATQTSRLIANYRDIARREAEVVLVYPVGAAAESTSVQDFERIVRRESKAETPFPLVLDVELRAVDQLGIRADLAKPSTYLLDKQGRLRFAYVGATPADRPSVQSILEQLDALAAESSEPAAEPE